jgi:2-polyprenyl-3-methyl-5-hydroxy-6-metoxy-1,4-benzoquinol methylase
MPKHHDLITRHDYPCWCEHTEAKMICKQMFGRRPFVVLECRHCRTQRILPRALADESAARELYNEYASGGLFTTDLDQVEKKMFPRLQQVGIAISRESRVLDVGCGSGSLLNAICRRFECAGLGVDIDKRRIEAARSQSSGARFECGFYDPEPCAGQFDIVISNAVIEHVVAPCAFLREMGRALRPGGSMFVLTPNASSLSYRILRSWWRELLSIGEHIYLFTPESLAACARQAGLEQVQMGSAYDPAAVSLGFGSPREFFVGIWGTYRETVKRLASKVSTAKDGDILYAHFTKS